MRLSRTVLPPLLLLTACSSPAREPTTSTLSLADTVGDAGDVAEGGADAAPPDEPTVLPEGLRYDQVQQTSIRATWMPDGVLFDKLMVDRVRSVALGPPAAIDPIFANWPFGALPDGFAVLRAFHAAVPDHEVLTVWIEDDGTSASAADFDAQVATALGRDAIFAPSDFVARCKGATTLREAVDSCRWPTLNELRGKMLVVRTWSDSALDAYVAGGAQANDRLAFIAPDLVAAAQSSQSAVSAPPHVVFSNREGSPLSEKPLLDALPQIVARNEAYRSSNAWLAMKQEGLHHIGSSIVDAAAHPSITTVTPRGSVFTCRGGANGCQGRTEASDAIAMGVTSGDIGGASDSFVFEYQTGASPGTTWSAYVAGSAVERTAKGCLMARASLDADAPYFAVCRVPGRGSVRVQSRAQKGGASTVTEVQDAPGAPARLQLATADALGLNCFSGAIASGGGDATQVGAATCFSLPLPFQGIAASSNGGTEAKLVFANVQRAVALPNSPVAPGSAAASALGLPSTAGAGVASAQVTSFRAFPVTSAVGASATASPGTCSISFAGQAPDGTYSAWEPAGPSFSLDGVGSTAATAAQLALDGQGNLIASGTAKGPNGYEWVTRQGTAGGTSWTTLDRFQSAPGVDTFGAELALFTPAGGGAPTLVGTGSAGSWPNMSGVLRTSTNGGATWTATDLKASGLGSGCSPVIDGSGLTPQLYLGCQENDPSNHSKIVVHRQALGGTVWTPADNFSWPFSWGTDMNELALDSAGSMFEIGRIAGDPSGGQTTRLLIRRKLSNQLRFTNVASWSLASGHDANPGSFAEDKVRHILYVSGVAEDLDGTSYAYVLRSAAKDSTLAGGAWSLVSQFQLVPGKDAQFIGIGVDHAGNVYVGGSAVDANGLMRWVIRASTDQGATWVTTDVFAPAPDSQGFAISHILEGADGNMYVAGAIGKIDANGWNSSSWFVRRSLCR